MLGVNAGYDSRPMATSSADTGVNVRNLNTVFYQQVAAGLEAVSNTCNFNAYALIHVGTSEYRLNSNYFGGALDTYGLDVGYAITPDFKASVGYYYQQGDLGAADSSGVLGRLSYNISMTKHLRHVSQQILNIALVPMAMGQQARRELGRRL